MWAKSGVKEKQDIVVVKVGGSLIRSPSDYEKISKILVENFAENAKVAVVISAIKGVTDLLISICNGNKGSLDEVIEIHRRFSRELGLEGSAGQFLRELEEEIIKHRDLCKESPIHRDRVLSIGERFSALAMAKILGARGLRVRIAWPWDIGIITDDVFGDAAPKVPAIYSYMEASITKILGEGYIPIIPGFIGVTSSGHITTMGRGSSDLTAVLVARAVGAEKTVLLTETPGILTADPRVVPNAYTVEKMDFVESERASRYRVKGLSDKMFKYVGDYWGEIHILDLGMRGTKICRGCRREGAKVIAPLAGGASIIGWGSGNMVKSIANRSSTAYSYIEFRDDVETLVLSKIDPVELIRILHSEVFGR